VTGPKHSEGTRIEELDEESASSDNLQRDGSDNSASKFFKLQRRFSYPLRIDQTVESVQDLSFNIQLNKIKTAFIEDQYEDNVYAE
jgi:hypothetical protein